MKLNPGRLCLSVLCIGIVITAGMVGWMSGGGGPGLKRVGGTLSEAGAPGAGRQGGLVPPLRQGQGTAPQAGAGQGGGGAGIDWRAVPVVEARPGPFQERLLRGAQLLQRRRVDAAAGRPARELRLWRTDFKHPLVREEAWLLRDGQGREVVVRREFSVADHAMLRFPGEVAEAEVRAWAEKRGLRLRQALKTAPVWLVAAPGDATLDTAEAIIRAFERDFPAAGQAVAERDFLLFPTLVPNDSAFSQLWGLNNTGQTGGVPDADIDAPEAWDLATGSREVLVGVIDTGIDRGHPDLVANLWTNPREVAGNGVDDDGNGFVDDVHGWDFFAGDNDPTDENNHGTHCAGTIGGVGNNVNGVAGVCWQVSMVGIRFLGPNGGSTSDAVESVNYARGLGVALTSNSWGGGGHSALLQAAIQAAEAAGQLFVAAAGNDGQNTDALPNYPSGYPLAGIVAVAASTDRDARATFSNYGAVSVDLAAPGAGIYSTVRGGGYASFNGTSMATPHVAGAAALLLSVAPGLAPAEVKARLMTTVDALPAFTSTTAARGRLNLARLIQQSAGPRPLAQVTSVREAAGGGNGDGVLNPGETLELYFTVTNRGTETAQNVSVGIAPVAAGSAFTVLRGSLPVGTLAVGAAFTSPTPFLVRSAAGAATPLAEELEITLTYGAAPRTLTQRHSMYLLTSSRVEGRVTDAATRAPLAGAVVRLAGPSVLTATTDADGRYRVLATDGAYQATAAAAGFLTASAVSVSVPPGRTGVDFALGVPRLSITPPMVRADLFTARPETRRLELRNLGSAGLTWSLRLSGQPPEAAAPLTVLPARTVHPGRGDADTGPRSFFKDTRVEQLPELAAPLGALTGVTVGLVSTVWDRAVLLADLRERGAAIVTLTPPLTATALAGVDVLLVDDALAGMSSGEITLVRARVGGGMGLLCEADDAGTMAKVNQLFQGTGITAVHDGYRDVTYTDIRPHPMTAGVARLAQVSVGASAVVAGQALTLVGADGGRAHAALAALGGGVMLFTGNEITDEANFVTGDGRRFANQVVEGLAAGPAWLSATPLSGTLAPGLSQVVDLRLDPRLSGVGRHEAYAVFQTNIPGEATRVVPVDLEVADAPELSLSAAALDFGLVVEGVAAERALTVANTGTEELRVGKVETAGQDPQHFQVLPAEPFTLAPGASRVLTVRFSTTAPLRLARADLALESNDPLRPAVRVPLQGQRQLAPDVLGSPAGISLRLREGEAGTATAVLRNRGRGPLRWQAALERPQGGVPTWATLPGISGMVAAGGVGQVRVLVDATAAGPGAHAAVLVVSTNDVDTPEVRVPVTLVVQAVPLPRAAAALEVAEVVAGQQQAFQIPVQNAGSTPLLLGPGIVVSSSFRFITRFPVSVPAGETRLLDLVFAPRAAGRHSGTVLVATNARSGPLFIRLSGQARLGPRLAAVPAAVALTMAPGAEMVRWLRVTNTGDRDLAWDMELEEPAPPWLLLEGGSPVLRPRHSSQAALRLRTDGLAAGIHTATVRLTQAETGAVTRVPLRLTVRAGAALALEPRAIHLPRAWAGHVEQAAFRAENRGNLPLTLRAIRPGHARLALTDAAPTLPVVLQPGEGLDVPFTFTTEVVGRFADAFFITTSLDPARPLRLPVTSIVSQAPVLGVTPGSLDVEVAPGDEAAASLSLRNTGGDVLEWTLSARNGTGPARDLEGVLAAVQASPTLLTGLLPSAHALTEGLSGTSIQGGGAGMYRVGNQVSTDLGSGQLFDYSNATVTTGPPAGAGGGWFTLKTGPLWMLAARLDGAGRFRISGGLGAAGVGRVTGGSVTRTVAGVAYRGFYKRVTGAPVPSVNHLIIVEDRPGLEQRYDAADTGSDFHEVSGLSGRSRVYYLMFGLAGSMLYPENSFGLLMDTFLRQMVHQESPDWLAPEAASGAVAAGQAQPLGLVLSPAQLLPGTYAATLNFATNSPVSAAVPVPVTMRVPARARLEPSPVRFDFPDTFLGRVSELSCTLRNPGNQALTVSAIQPDDPAFSVLSPVLPLVIPRGGSAGITLRFSPTRVAGLASALVIQSDAHGAAELRLPITARGLRGPVMVVGPAAITTTLEPGASSQHVLSVANQGDAALSWTATPAALLTGLAGVAPASGLVLAGAAQEPVLGILTTATTAAGTYPGWVRVAGNDAASPFIDVPVTLTVSSRPRGELSRTDLPFGNVVLGTMATGSFTVRNVGNASLRINSCTVTDGALAVTGAVFPLTLAVGGSRTLTVQYQPAAPTAMLAEVRLAAATPALPAELVLRVSGQGVPPPVLAAQPLEGFDLTLKKGQSASPALTVRNDGGSTLDWQAAITDRSTPAGTLEDVRQRINAAHQDITALIPDLHDFEEGVLGTHIYDGGNDMYDFGNYLGTNLGGNIPYSDDFIASRSQLGTGGACFTRKHPGLFLFVADLGQGVTSFDISGNLGADGYGTVATAVIDRSHGGREYVGYFKGVSGAWDASVNHLIIVERKPALSRTYSSNTDRDDHAVSGLSGGRLYYLLFSRRDGLPVSAELAGQVMDVFLDRVALPPAAGWITVTPAVGFLPAAASTQAQLLLESRDLPLGTHTANLRLTGNAPGGSPLNIPVRLTVEEPDITTHPARLELLKMDHAAPAMARITVTARAGQSPAWTAAASAPWLVLSKTAGTGSDEVGVSAGASLPPGMHTGFIGITAGGVTQTVPVTLTVRAPAYTRLFTDHRQPGRVLGLVRGTGGQPSLLVALDAASLVPGEPLPLPTDVTDADLTTDHARLYAISFSGRSITEVDLDRFTVTRSRPLPVLADFGTTDPYHYDIQAGRTGIVYYTDAGQPPQLHVFDFEAGADLSTFLLSSGAGIADFHVSPDGGFIHAVSQSSWSGAGTASIVRLNSAGTSLSQTHTAAQGIPAAPLRAGVFFTAGRDAVLTRSMRLTPLLDSRQDYTRASSIAAVSAYGHALVFADALVEGLGGTTLATLPGGVAVAAFTAAQDALVYQHPVQQRPVRLPLAGIVALPAVALRPGLPDGSVISTALPTLSWSGLPTAASYDVYLGTGAAAVAAATPATAGVFRLNTTGVSYSLPVGSALLLGGTYYWRIDARAPDGTVVAGPVWSFTMASAQGALAGPEPASFPGGTAQNMLNITTAAPSTAWTLAKTAPWLTLGQGGGTGPAAVQLSFSAGTLARGTYSTQVTLRSGTHSVEIPVSFRVLGTPDIRKLVADPVLPVVYGLHREVGDSLHFMLWIDAATASITHVTPLGFDASDFIVQAHDDRIYVLRSSGTSVTILQRQQQRQVLGTWQFANPAATIHNGPTGRVVLRGINHELWMRHAGTGGAVGSVVAMPQSMTDGPADGSYVLAASQDGLFSTRLTRYPLTSTGITTGVAVQLPMAFTHSHNLRVSGDGSRAFHAGIPYDAATLTALGPRLGGLYWIGACSWTGQVAWGGGQGLAVPSGAVVGTLPAQVLGMVSTADDRHLILHGGQQQPLFRLPAPVLPPP